MSILKTNNLSKTYGTKENEVKALKSTNIEIEEGQFISIIGASGSGKSTLLHLLAGLDKPSTGKVYINDKDIYDLPEKELAKFRSENIGFIFQSFNLIPILSVEENIKLPVLIDKKAVNDDYINELIEILDLGNRKSHLPSELSGGQQQRVAVARALANNPSIIFADEPTGNLDRKNSFEVLSLLENVVKKYKKTLIIITHDVSIASRADRIITISDGEIIKDENGLL
jgi:putative ABC transport system ATP-binding protein